MNGLKVTITESENYSYNAVKVYRSIGQVSLMNLDDLVSDPDTIVLVIRLGVYIDAAFLALFPNVEVIVSPTTGHTHIDEKLIDKRKIKLISLRGERKFLDTIPSTAEFTWLKIMSSVRNDLQYVDHVRSGGWDRYQYLGRNLGNISVGVIGNGRVATQLASFASVFGTKLYFHDVDPARSEMPLQPLLKQCDVIVLTASYEPEKYDYPIIGECELESIKSDAVLINTARGQLVDEEKLLVKLQTNKDFFYYTDVITQEHDLPNSKLLDAGTKLKNLAITPHVSGATVDSMHATEEFCANKLRKFFKESGRM